MKEPDLSSEILATDARIARKLMAAVDELAKSGLPPLASAHTMLRLYAFFAMAMFAAAYHIIPRITGRELCPAWMKIHFVESYIFKAIWKYLYPDLASRDIR